MRLVPKSKSPIAVLTVWLAACGLVVSQETVPELQKDLERQKKVEVQKKDREFQKEAIDRSSGAAAIPARPSPPVPPNATPRVTTPVQPAPTGRSSAVTQGQIVTWIRELDATEFFTRETAML